VARVNEHYLKLKSSYLFSEIARRVREFQNAHPDARIIRLGIGDVTQPLPSSVIRALHEAVDEMARAETFRGYGPEPGYEFLTALIAKHDYGTRGVSIAPDEIFVSDGGKTDGANIQEIFAADSVIAVTDPVYPVYLDSNVMAGRTGAPDDSGRYGGVVYLPCTAENNFEPPLPDRPVDLVYLCYPNNPTGSTLTKSALARWVEWARKTGAVIMYDAAYVSYIREAAVPHSIYEIEGAREVAIELRSYSKSAGFTGTRCAYTVVPKEATAGTVKGERVGLNGLWFRRQSTKFNGVPYVIQKGAAAVYTDGGQAQVRALVDHYMENTRIIRRAWRRLASACMGAATRPHLAAHAARTVLLGLFDKLLNEVHVVGTPGSGFGPSGEGYFRLTGFGSRAQTQEAIERIKTRLAR
jgi:LL-diaminopimelate aminotransferase